MRVALIAAIVSAAGLTALAQSAAACPNGYHAVWIDGNKVCRITTPKLPLKVNKGRELKGASRTLKTR